MSPQRLLPLALVFACAKPVEPAARPAGASESPESEDENPASTASAAPDSEIYVAELELAGAHAKVGAVRNATARPGYDNQPFFIPATHRFFYTSIRDGQADIYVHDADAGTSALVHADPANEYSPTLMPGGRGISMIREAGGVQKLWHYSLAGEDLGPVLPDVVDVGYHAWLSADDVALFVLDTEHGRHRLEIVHVPDGARHMVAENIGRGLAIYPRGVEPTGSITFVALAQDPDSDADPESSPILRYDLKSDATTQLLETRPGSQDYAWAPDGSLLMPEKTVLYRWTQAGGWQRVADLARDGVAEVTRIAVSEDGTRLAFVGMPTPG